MRQHFLKRVAGALGIGVLALAIIGLPACRRTGQVNGGGAAAAVPWTWEGGASTVNAVPTFGTQGSGVTGNVPGARDSAATWQDAQGNFWLFGGHGIDSSGSVLGSKLNDLWKYSPSTAIWTWIGGAQTGGSAGVYGIRGQAASTNMPGARIGAMTWTDASGNFWMFGGLSNLGNLNDLWKYTPNGSAGQWTWVSGSNLAGAPGTYGTLGSSGQGSNVPGARSFASTWVDTQGNLWLFGGQGFDSLAASGYLSDVWEFNTTQQVWTWMGGPNVANQAGTYTATATAPATTAPGGRESAMTWITGPNTVWLFGGIGYDAARSNGLLNDLWQLDLATMTWKYVAGATTIDGLAIYGTQGVAGSTNTPAAREGGLAFTDAQGRLWIFGGDGWTATAASSQAGQNALNDVWRFDPSAGQWTWLGGAQLGNAPGSYGTLGKQTATNTPGARASAAAWSDRSGNIWLFGGYGADASATLGELGDLWEVVP